MNLFTVEVRRLLSRRLLKWLTIVLLAGFVFAAVMVFINSDGDFFFSEMPDILTALSFPMVSLGLLLGGTGIGAEWNNRTMTSSLTWEPRRGRLLTAKYAAICSVAFLWTLSLMLSLTLLLWLVATQVGNTDGLDSGLLREIAEVMLRVGFMGAIGGLMGAGIATVGRNTAASLAVAFSYIIVVENLVRAFKTEWSYLLFGDNAARFILGSEDMGLITHSQTTAGIVLIAYGLGCCLVGWAVFRQREVA